MFKPSGFTIIELLAATGIFSIIGTIVVAMIFFTLRSTTRVDLTEGVRKNGDITLSQIARTIRYAGELNSPTCVPTASASAITVTSLDNKITTFACDAVDNTITANDVSFINTQTMSITNCSFICRQPTAIDQPSITIKFTLNSKDPQSPSGTTASLPFQTSIVMRNVNSGEAALLADLPDIMPTGLLPTPTAVLTPGPTAVLTPGPTGVSSIESGEIYKLTNQCSNKALEVYGLSTADGVQIQQWTWHWGTNQLWKIESVGSGDYRLTAQSSNKALEVYGLSTADGVQIQQWTWHGGTNQLWKIESVGSGDYRLTAQSSNKALAVAGGSTADGAPVQQWSQNTSCDQKWKIEPIRLKHDTPGAVQTGNIVNLRNSNTTGTADIAFNLGQATDKFVAGDWNGDGIDTVGVFRNGAWYLRNSNSAGPHDIFASFGRTDDIPVVGDWDGNGIDTLGVVRGNIVYLRNSNTTGVADITFDLGQATDKFVAGDWNGDGIDTVGVFRNGAWYLRNYNSAGPHDIFASFGQAGDTPIVGDWDGNGTDTIGFTRGNSWSLRNSNTTGVADIFFFFGSYASPFSPIIGDWDGK